MSGQDCCIVGCYNYYGKNRGVSDVSFPKSGKDKATDEWRRKLIAAVARADNEIEESEG